MLSEARATLLARWGFAARGLVYLLVAWFAVDAAFRGGRTADNQGAIASLADKAFGPLLLAVIAAGLAGYALWRLAEAVAGPGHGKSAAKTLLERAGFLMSAGAHLVLAWVATRFALHPRSGSDTSPNDERARDWTAWLLDQPFGPVLVGAVAIGFFCGAGLQLRKAWKGEFVAELHSDTPVPGYVCTAGRIGYGARALVFAVTGLFFAAAAWRSRASEAGGMADALGALQDQPGGTWLLAATGIGLGLFGIFSLIEARYRRIRVRV
ncbi:hypothetical protein FHS95_001468 [Sphingomonas naasensis]|uniref:DUF1206 domain-containing protein n=1 Tax=Sphingomonas naasensis TaxID=1344951 RepID=A0A4S1WGX8_9SPHN|nr:DUF1206 domain-containing protein [Sphingomonas naasensis]NIJ19799.1 hypothetical protein [Sphingomonas naasensis]TGX40066.1 DUF1206 domain-containing protein [Sphingomonas naasensis]